MATTITYKGSDLTSFSNTSKILRTAGKYLEGDITITTYSEVNNQNKTVIPSETTQSITADTGYSGLGTVTVNGITNTYVGSGVNTTPNFGFNSSYNQNTNRIKSTVTVSGPVYIDTYKTDTRNGNPDTILPTQSATTIIPSESAQTIVDAHKWTTGTVTVAAITPTYIGSGVTTRSSLTVSGPTVTASAGYYASDVTATIPNASLTQRGTSLQNLTGARTYTISWNLTPGYISTAPTAKVSFTEETLTITPTNSTQTLTPTGAYYYIEKVIVEPIPSEYVVPTGTLTITHAGTTSVTNYANVDVPEARYFTGMNWGYTTQNNQRKFQFLPRTIVDPEEGGQAGWIAEGVYDGLTSTFSAVPSGITITPTQTTQTIGGTNYMMEGPVTVAAVTTGYLKGMLTMPTDIDFSTGHTPTATWTVEPSGMVIYQCYGSGSITNAVYSSGYIENTQQIPAEYEAGGSYQLPTQGATTVIPSETAQTLSVNQKYMTGNVTVAAITSTYVGSGITRNPTITVSGPSVTIPAGYYSSQQTKTVASGSIDTTTEPTVTYNPNITVSSSGLISASNSGGEIITINVNPGYIASNATLAVNVAGTSTYQLSTLGAQTITPSSATQTVSSNGKYMTGNVTVNPIPSQYIVPSGTYTISSVDSTNTFNVTNYASAKVTITDADSIAY